MKKKTKNKLADVLTLASAALIVISIGAGVWVLPRPIFSEDENRPLSPAPTLSADALLSGRFFSALSSFYADSVPLRPLLVRAKAVTELSLGKRENNGVLFLEGGALADRCEYADTALLEQNIDLLCGTHWDAGAAVPRSIDVCADGEYARHVRDAVYSRLYGEELYLALRASAGGGERPYYRTDHHLDADGAYILYCHIVRQLGEQPYAKADFERQAVSDSFLGSAYSAGGLLAPRADTLTLMRHEGDLEYEVKCTDPNCSADSIYCFDFLNKKDKYSVLTGGNHPILTVRKSGEQRKTLLLVKDSFANAVVPMLCRHFDLVVYDPRYTSAPLPDCDMSAFVFGIDTLATTRLSIGEGH